MTQGERLMSMQRHSTSTPHNRFTSWFRHLFASLRRWLRGAPAQSAQSESASPLDSSVTQQTRASQGAGGQTEPGMRVADVTLTPWEYPNPQARLASGWPMNGVFGAPDVTPPFAPRPLAARVTRSEERRVG